MLSYLVVFVLHNEPLSRHTTLRAGGPAKYFIQVDTDTELAQAVRFAKDRALGIWILGSGSNLLPPDSGFPGVVLKLSTKGIRSNPLSDTQIELIAEAGEDWDAVVAFAVERDLYGLENMSAIPGTVGGAVVGNIGAYGTELGEVLLWAECLDNRTGLLRRFSHQDCGLAYRHTWFKTSEGRGFIVLRAGFSVRKNGLPTITYSDLASYFASRMVERPSLREVREAILAIRRQKLPDLALVGTAGSFFKNPILAKVQYDALRSRYPGLPGWEEPNGLVKVPAGWILDKICGLRGWRKGRVGTHTEQALVVINEGGTASEVEALANEMAEVTWEKTGIHLEWEVEKMRLG